MSEDVLQLEMKNFNEASVPNGRGFVSLTPNRDISSLRADTGFCVLSKPDTVPLLNKIINMFFLSTLMKDSELTIEKPECFFVCCCCC